MAIQEVRDQLYQQFQILGKIQQNNKFLFSCISEGLIPSGLTFNFNLAKFVNDEAFVKKIQTFYTKIYNLLQTNKILNPLRK